MTTAPIMVATKIRPAERDGIPLPRRHWAHVAVGLAVTMSSMDGSIANVALPNISHVLHVTPADSIWVVNAYQLSVCMALLIIGSLGDIHGYDKIFRFCLVLFTAASLACAMSHDLRSLSIARFAQGLGGAGILGVTNAMLRGIYPARELAKGIGRNTIVVAVSLAIGPTVASFILSIASWPWLFAVNVPIGIITLIVARWALPKFPGSGHPFDAWSALLSACAFALAVLGIDGLGHQHGKTVPLLELGLATCAGYFLIRRQRSIESPLLPVDLLRIKLFKLSVSTTFLASMAQLMAYVAIPFFLHARGCTQVQIGLLITPWPVMVGVIAPLAGRLATNYSAGLLASLGLAVLAVGLILLASLPLHVENFDIIGCMLVCGIGYGIFLPPNSATQIASVPKLRSGGASTLGATARVVGQAIGAALVAGLFGVFPIRGIAFSLIAAAAIACLGAVVSAGRHGK